MDDGTAKDRGEGKVLNAEQARQILEKRLTVPFILKELTVKPLSSQLDGLLGDQYIATIQYESDGKVSEEQFFVKILDGDNPVMFEIAKSIQAFEKEQFFYRTVIPMYEKVGLPVQIFPKCYFTHPYIVVLENLAVRGFKGWQKSKPLDLQHCKACLETLARFHANSIIFEEKSNCRLDSQYKDILKGKLFSNENNAAAEFLKASVEGFHLLIDLLPDNLDSSEANTISKEQFSNKLKSIFEDSSNSNDLKDSFRKTILHGDLWSNNFMFQYSNDQISSCKLIDFQIVHYGSPAMDVLQFIFTNTRSKFRKDNFQSLLEYYFQNLQKYFQEANLDKGQNIISEEEFQKSCAAFKIDAKIQAITDRAITCMPEELYVEVAQNEDTFREFLFDGRGKYIVRSFQENKDYRELMIEDILDLKQILFDKTN